MRVVGVELLAGYVLFVGVATFLQKAGMRELTAYQINVLMALGMLAITLPALLIHQHSLAVPLPALPIGALIGLLMALGSVLFVFSLARLPVGMAVVLSTSYVLLMVVLSCVFLREPMNLPKLAGIVLTVAGVVILARQA